MENENLYFLLLLILIIPLTFLLAYCCKRKSAPKLQKIQYFPAPAPKIEYYTTNQSQSPPKYAQMPTLCPVYIPATYATLPNEGISAFQIVDVEKVSPGLNGFSTLDYFSQFKDLSNDSYPTSKLNNIESAGNVLSDIAVSPWMPSAQ